MNGLAPNGSGGLSPDGGWPKANGMAPGEYSWLRTWKNLEIGPTETSDTRSKFGN